MDRSVFRRKSRRNSDTPGPDFARWSGALARRGSQPLDGQGRRTQRGVRISSAAARSRSGADFAPRALGRIRGHVGLFKLALGLVLAGLVAVALAPAQADAAVAYTAWVGNYGSGTLTPINTQTGLRARSPEIGTGADATVGLIGCTRGALPFSA